MKKAFFLTTGLPPSPLIDSGDDIILDKRYSMNYTSPEKYISNSSFNDPEDNKYHIGLSPLPFLGNLSQASVFILMLNPGLHISDYFTENNPVFRKHLEDNFNQTLEEFPFYFLNPKLGFHAGFDYWNNFLKYPRETLCERLNISRNDAQVFLAKEIAVLELIPYHALKNPNTNKTIMNLPSVKAVKDHAKRILQPRAFNGEILILNVRSVRLWDLERGDNILTNFTRKISLDPEKANGRRLLNFLIDRYKS